MNGAELAQHVLAICPAIKVLYMSGYTNKALTSTAAWEPGPAFLQKPFTPQTLGHKVREILTAPQTESYRTSGIEEHRMQRYTDLLGRLLQ